MKIDLVEVNKEHLKICLELLTLEMLALKLADSAAKALRGSGQPTIKVDGERRVLLQAIDIGLGLLLAIAFCPLTDKKDFKQIRAFFQEHPFCLERMQGLMGREYGRKQNG